MTPSERGAPLEPLFRPRSMAVSGPSKGVAADGAPKLGTAAITHLVEHGFQGSIRPERVDLGILVLPAEACVAAIRECGDTGGRAAIEMPSGFAEAGQERLQDELTAVGLIVIGVVTIARAPRCSTC